MAENKQNRPDNYYVSEREPEAQAPPALETGVLKWVRENLFNSILNTILTILGILLIYVTITGVSSWIIRDANWMAVTVNMRNFMVGSYEREYQWRASLTLFISVFAIGAAVSIWIRQIARTMLIAIVVIILSVQVVPRLINATLQLPSWYAGAGNVEFDLGQTSELPFGQIAFIGRQGDDIRIALAEEATDEEALANITGYVDNIANPMRNAAINRLEEIETLENLQDLVNRQAGLAVDAVPVLTASQFEEYSAEVESAEIPESVIDAYNINQIPVLVEITEVTRVVDSETEEVTETTELIASVILTDADDVLELTLRQDGWYILRKELVLEGATLTEGLALLEVRGIYPSAQRVSTVATVFTRRPDGFSIEDQTEPEIDGEPLPFIDIIRNQYRGDRPLNDYLRSFVSPFLLSVANFVTITVVCGLAGFFFTEMLRSSSGEKAASSFGTYALVSIPVIVWILINGLYLYSVMMWLLFASMCLVIYLLYMMVKRDGYNPTFIGLGVAVVLGFVVILIVSGEGNTISNLFSQGFDTEYLRAYFKRGFDLPRLLTLLPLVIDGGAVPRLLTWLVIIVAPLAIYLGKNAHIPGDELEFNMRLYGGLAAFFFILVVIATQVQFEFSGIRFFRLFDWQFGSPVIFPVTIDTEWFLQPSDPRQWGGLLLTMVLTIYGIIIAFPIGLGLALGRRSDLPLIKYLCTFYIEVVRGSPFITVLFFMQLFIPLIRPEFSEVPGGYRAIVATIMFSAAYLAENVRGGLQSLPPGQEEAAKALGLNPWQTVSLITLPQALRAVIPALVGQFISLFKDTSLVTIVGLTDLVGVVKTVTVQAEFIGTQLEGLLFISILYFVFSFVMSYVSRLLEASGSGSTRRM